MGQENQQKQFNPGAVSVQKWSKLELQVLRALMTFLGSSGSVVICQVLEGASAYQKRASEDKEMRGGHLMKALNKNQGL